jgi:hypothetical protein
MPLLLLVLIGALTIGFGYWCRRRDPDVVSVHAAIKIVPISFGLALSIGGGLVPSVYTAVSLGWAKYNGRTVDDIRPFLLPGTNVDEFVQSMLIATVLLAIIAVIEYIRMCKSKI